MVLFDKADHELEAPKCGHFLTHARFPQGPVVRDASQATRLCQQETGRGDGHVRAAEHFNRCRAAGIAGSPVDFLICAAAERLAVPIFTTDVDFPRFARHVPIRLFSARSPFPRACALQRLLGRDEDTIAVQGCRSRKVKINVFDSSPDIVTAWV
jgi:hypothetical protein